MIVKPRIVNEKLCDNTTLITTVFVLVLLMQTQAFCSDAAYDMDALASDIVNKVSQAWIRKIVAALSGVWGICKCYGAGNFFPLIFWGVLSLFLLYMPQIISWF